MRRTLPAFCISLRALCCICAQAQKKAVSSITLECLPGEKDGIHLSRSFIIGNNLTSE